MRKILWLVIAVVLGLSALASTPRALSATDRIAPQVVDTVPTRGEELSIDGAITFYFDLPMDRASVESAFKTTPDVRGSFQWQEDRAFAFKPNQPLTRASEYTFTLDETAKSAAGVGLRERFSIKLRTVGFLEVVESLPENKTQNVEATPTITIIFNRPVVPLVSIDEQAKLPSPIRIQPSAEGTGQWLNTSIYTFKPKGLKGGTSYTVTVAKGLTDVTGSVLKDDYVFTFTTVQPNAIEVTPENGADNMLLDRKVFVTFSQPMDTAATEAAFSLAGPDGKPIAGDFAWNEEKERLTFTPKARLDYDRLYTIKVDRTKALSVMGAPLSADLTSSFSTLVKPTIASTWPENDERNTRYSGFSINFTAPMDLTAFAKRVTIEPKPGLKFDDQTDDDKFFFVVGFSHEPSTDYTVTVDLNGLVDIWGTPVQLDPNSRKYRIVAPGKVQIKFNTAAYPPEASLRTGSRIGLYSAYNASTRVFSTHRNINRVNLSLASVPMSDFLQLVGPNGYQFEQRYRPTTTLRSWGVPVENPQNILRYDLLTISDTGPSGGSAPSAVACPGAPAPRLAVGGEALVLPDDPTPLRIRETPGRAGKVLTQVNVGEKFSVIEGPTCADGFLWWRLRSADGKVNGWVAEGDTKNYFVGPVLQSVAPNAGSGPLKPGVYWLVFSSPELPSTSRELRHIMVVATANITLKASENEVLAWITDLQSGKPVADAEVALYDKPASFYKARTDANGVARFKLTARLSSMYVALTAILDDGKNFGVGTLNWDDGISPWDFNQEADFYPETQTVYMYSDRSLYRPGQPVYFRGAIRNRADMTYTLANNTKMPVIASDNRGQIIFQKEVTVTEFGTFSDSFTIDEDAPLGYYTITALPGFTGGDLKKYNGPRYSRGINVAQYRVPEFQVKVNAEKDQVVQGDKIKVNVESTFFFGGAVSNVRVEWSVFSDSYYFDYTGPGRYDFYDFNEDEGYYRERSTSYGNEVAQGKGKTDAQGKFTIEVPASLGKAKQSQNFVVEARVIDESDQLIAGRAEVIVHQGEFYIGASAENYVGAATKPQKINLISVGWDSKAKPNSDLSVRVVERRWRSTQTVEPETGRTVWNYDVDEKPVTDGVVRTDGEGKAVFTFTPPIGGVYKIYATSRDARGNQISTSTFLWVAGPDYVPWRQQNSNRIDLKIDRDNYKVGDTASILIASPFQGEAVALVSVERGHILKSEVVTMPNNSYVYQLPITPDMAPNAYVSVMIVKGVDAKNPVAAFRVGLVQFGVQTEQLNLKINVTPDKPQAGPRETVNYKLKVTDYMGEPVQAEVGVGLTDLATLSLLPDTSTPILRHFYSQTGLGVRTSASLTVSVDQQTQEIINTVKGGGGGGPEGGIFEVRQLFIDTPLWSPAVKTDSNGEAVVKVTLPDQLTTWRLDARAITKPIGKLETTLVGQTTFDLISTKPLLIRPVTPRFYVVNDSSTLVAIVNNNTGQDQDVKARIEVKGLTLKDPAERTGKIPSLGRLRFEWQVEVQDVQKVDVTFFASSADGKYTDAAKSAVGQGEDKSLPVLRYEVPETVGTGGTIDAKGGSLTEGISLPRRFNVTQGTLNIRLDRSLAASTVDALEVLRYFPYYCTEQTISRFLPNVATYGAFTKLKVENAALKKDVEEALSAALQRLYADQKVDGGWGWFSRDQSSPLTTAYAVIGLSEAQKQGFTVDQRVVERAIKFLRDKQTPSTSLTPQTSAWMLNRDAFIQYALAYAQAGSFSRAVTLYNIRDKMSIYARAYLAMTFNLIDPQNKDYTNTLISDLQNRAVASATGMHWEESFNDYINWNTDTRTTAIALKALIQIQPTSPLIPNVVRWLMVARTADAWETTQETAWAVMALVNWMQYTGELKPNYTFDASLNDKTLTSKQTAAPDNVRDNVQLQVAVKDLLAGQVNALTINRTAGDGNLYYTAHLTAYLPVEQVKAASRGITISRTYSLANDKDHKPITQARVGDNIRVTLNIVVPSELNYAVITDPIPAGAEAVNPDLATSAVGESPELNLVDPFGDGWGWWWFSHTELRDDRAVLYATYLPRGTYTYTYILRAGLAGQYRVIPPSGQEFYFPEVYGRGDGSVFTILPAPPGTEDPTTPANK